VKATGEKGVMAPLPAATRIWCRRGRGVKFCGAWKLRVEGKRSCRVSEKNVTGPGHWG